MSASRKRMSEAQSVRFQNAKNTPHAPSVSQSVQTLDAKPHKSAAFVPSPRGLAASPSPQHFSSAGRLPQPLPDDLRCLCLRRSLEPLSHGRGELPAKLRSLLAAEAIAEVEDEVSFQAPHTRARSLEDAADLLRLLGPLDTGTAQRCGVESQNHAGDVHKHENCESGESLL